MYRLVLILFSARHHGNKLHHGFKHPRNSSQCPKRLGCLCLDQMYPGQNGCRWRIRQRNGNGERERDIIRQAQLVALERALKVFEEETFGISTVNIEKYLNELTVSRISYTYVLLTLENNFGFFILLSYYFFSRKRGLFAVLNKCLSSWESPSKFLSRGRMEGSPYVNQCSVITNKAPWEQQNCLWVMNYR